MKINYFYNMDAPTDTASVCPYCGDALFHGTALVAVTNGDSAALAHEECHLDDLAEDEDE